MIFSEHHTLKMKQITWSVRFYTSQPKRPRLQTLPWNTTTSRSSGWTDTPTLHSITTFFWSENTIPSGLSLPPRPCCSVQRGIRKHNSQEVHSTGTPRSLSSPPTLLFQASCSHSRALLFYRTWVSGGARVISTPPWWTKALKKSWGDGAASEIEHGSTKSIRGLRRGIDIDKSKEQRGNGQKEAKIRVVEEGGNEWRRKKKIKRPLDL